MDHEKQVAIFIRRMDELEREASRFHMKYVRLRASTSRMAKVEVTEESLAAAIEKEPREVTESSVAVEEIKAAREKTVEDEAPKEEKKSSKKK